MSHSHCYCGAERVGRRCADGGNCPRQALGKGHWHVAFPLLLRSLETRARYPRVDLEALWRHTQRHEPGSAVRRHRRDRESAPRRRSRTPQVRPDEDRPEPGARAKRAPRRRARRLDPPQGDDTVEEGDSSDTAEAGK